VIVSVMDGTVFENTSDVVFRLDEQWRFVMVNGAATVLFGRSQADLLYRNLWEEFPQLLGTSFESEYRRIMTQGGMSHFEAFSALGHSWLNVQIQRENGGILVFLRDISDRKQVEADVMEQSRLGHLMARVSRFLVHAHGLAESLQYCTDAIIDELDGAIAAIWVYNGQAQYLERQGFSYNGETSEPLLSSLLFQSPVLTLEHSIIGMIAQTQKPVVDLVFPAFGDPLQSGAVAVHRPLQSNDSVFCNLEPTPGKLPTKLHFVGYPMVLDERLIGVLALWSYQALRPLVYEGLGSLADSLAIDIDRCWARTALLSRREALLFRLANQIRNSLDLNTILDTAVHEIRQLLKVDCCTYLWCWTEGETVSLMVSHEAGVEANCGQAIATCPPERLTFLAEQIGQQRLLRIDDIQHPPPFPFLNGKDAQGLMNLLRDLEIQSLLLLPLKTRSDHLGAIACSQRRGVRHWSEQEIELLQAVVDQLALAIDQAELFAQTRAAALAAQTQAQQIELTLQELKRTQAQLIQTEKMSSLGQMIAGIAHEINNPVNFISGNLSYTSEYVNDLVRLVETYRQYLPDNEKLSELEDEIDLDFIVEDLPKTLASMQIGAESIRQIVLSLRNFSRLDQAEMKPVDIHEGLDNTLLILHNRLKAKGNRAEIEIIKNYGDLPPVDCYAGQLNQVFMNILANAIDAMEDEPEPRKITISTEFIPDPDHPETGDGEPLGDALIRLQDNGSGMSSETVSHIFDPFFTTKPVGKGTGLGLAISYQIIVEKHHGRITCDSVPGTGTIFTIQIPVQPPADLRKS